MECWGCSYFIDLTGAFPYGRCVAKLVGHTALEDTWCDPKVGCDKHSGLIKKAVIMTDEEAQLEFDFGAKR